MDLYRLYKQFYQRAYRNPYDDALVEMKDIAYELAKMAYQTSISNEHDDDARPTLFAKAARLEELEQKRGGFPKYFARGVSAKILEGSYIVEVPYQLRHDWNHQVAGYVYLMKAETRSGLVKMGATTMDPAYRATRYQSKFGYRVEIVHSVYVPNPFQIEKKVRNAIQQRRVAANTYGDSNEWYRISISDAKSVIQKCCYDADNTD